MNLGRILRTIRPLTAEQLVFFGWRRLRHQVWSWQPRSARARIAARARHLPRPDPGRPALGRIADQVALLQTAIHPTSVDDLRAGKLLPFGEALCFSSFSDIAWRADLGEGRSPLRRLTLAYFGWAVPLLATGRLDDLERVEAALTGLDSLPWSRTSIFRDLWNPYTACHRAINLLAGLHLHGLAGGSLESPAAAQLLEHIRFCVAFVVTDPERDLQANHLFKNWAALAVFAAAAPDPPAVFPFLTRAITSSLKSLVLGDGGHAERSPMYHVLGLLDVEAIEASGAAPLIADQIAQAAASMRTALGILSHPDGDIALFNDSWLGGAPSTRSLGVASPERGTHALAETGYVRLDGGKDVAIFDCGICGPDEQPAHAHADFLSFELSIDGVRFIVDPGTFTYSAGEQRDRCRSAAAHNGPHIDGVEPLELWSSFRVGRRAAAGGLAGEGLNHAPLWCAGWQDGYARSAAEPRRWIGLWPGRALLVVDSWIGAPSIPARSRFIVPRPWVPEPGRADLVFTGPQQITFHALLGRIEGPQTSVWWPRYGAADAATHFDIRPEKSHDVTSSALLVSWGTLPGVDRAKAISISTSLILARRAAPAGFHG